MMRLSPLALSACMAVGLAGSGLAQDLRVSGSTVSIDLAGNALVKLRIAGPDGFYQETVSKGSSASLQLGGKPADGLYKYEVSGATGRRVPNYNPMNLDNGRGAEPAMTYAGATASGTFLVKGGVIVVPKEGIVTNSDQDG